MNTQDIRETLTTKLTAFRPATNVRATALDFFKALGYHSNRTLATDGSPDAFRKAFDKNDPLASHSRRAAAAMEK